MVTNNSHVHRHLPFTERWHSSVCRRPLGRGPDLCPGRTQKRNRGRPPSLVRSSTSLPTWCSLYHGLRVVRGEERKGPVGHSVKDRGQLFMDFNPRWNPSLRPETLHPPSPTGKSRPGFWGRVPSEVWKKVGVESWPKTMDPGETPDSYYFVSVEVESWHSLLETNINWRL